jgi:hypothetical protein
LKLRFGRLGRWLGCRPKDRIRSLDALELDIRPADQLDVDRATLLEKPVASAELSLMRVLLPGRRSRERAPFHFAA